MRYLRYTWSALLLLAAILAPNITTTLTLLGAGLLTVTLAVLREKRLNNLVNELSDLLALRRQTSSVALERSLNKLQRHMLLLAVAAELLILLTLLLANLDITVARNYALLILVALAPLGLEAELAILLQLRQKRSSETVRTAIGYASEDAHALLAIIGLSFIGTVWLHIPPALSALQLLFITCVARPLLSGRALQSTPHKVDQAWRVLFVSLITYGSFIFFFIRHYVEPRYADTINVITWQATTVALLTFIVCQATILVFNPQAPKVTAWRAGGLLIILLAILYMPVTSRYLMAHGPAAADWVAVTVAGLLYTSMYVLLEASRQHSRQELLRLHRRSGRSKI